MVENAIFIQNLHFRGSFFRDSTIFYGMNRLLLFFENQGKEPDEINNNEDVSKLEAYLYGLLICASSVYITFFLHRGAYSGMRNGTLCKSILIIKIFEKSLKISQNTVNSSKIINLISNDVQRFERFFHFLGFIVVLPIFLLSVILLCLVINTWLPLIGGVHILKKII